MQNVLDAGALVLVGTPIGNLGDISPRAIQTLREVDLIACEDTRKTSSLLNHLGLKTPLLAYHDHNEQEQAVRLVDRIAGGTQVALVADAGMPTISDPGFRLVRACHSRGLKVTSVPGPSAAITALAVSGLPSDSFLFLGFLPPKKASRLRTFQTCRDLPYTLIFYESTHRIEKFLTDAEEVFGPLRVVSLCRELTKLYETVHTAPLAELRSWMAGRSTKGEFVVLVAKSGYTVANATEVSNESGARRSASAG